MKKQLLVINSKALGDTICATPTLRKLYNTYNQKISVLTYHPEIFWKNPYVDKVKHYNKANVTTDFRGYDVHETFTNIGNKHNNIEKKHNVFDIRQFHATDLGFMLTPEEMICEFYPLKETYEKHFDNYVVLHTTNTWSSRTWTKVNWISLIKLLEKNNINYILVGKDDSETGFFDIDKKVFDFDNILGLNLLNKTSLSQTWHIINNADCVVTMDSGLLHLAGTTKNTWIIQLGSSINPKFRAPYRKDGNGNINQDFRYTYLSGKCDLLCASDMKYGIKEWGSIQGVPPLIGCLENKSTFECHPTVKHVFNEIMQHTLGTNWELPKTNLNKKKLLYIAPHLSTGGMPKYLERCIELMKDEFEIYLIEHSLYSLDYIVQRNKILSMIDSDKFWSFEMIDDTKNEINNIIDNIKPDIIHLQEAPELFLEYNIANNIYSINRQYTLLETTHTTTLDLLNKKYFPDKFVHVGNYINNMYLKYFPDVPSCVVEYECNNVRYNKMEALQKLNLDTSLIHILNIGIFTPNKRQDYIFEMAKVIESKFNNKIQFHFIGNQANNFRNYWEPLVNNKPDNCIIHGEREDIDYWYSACDLFLFSSKLENNPLVLKEVEYYNIPLLVNNLDVYENKYIDNLNINLLENNVMVDVNNLIEILNKIKE